MTDQQHLLSFFYLKLAGQDARPDLMTSVQEINIESSLHMPDVATVTLIDQELRWTDGDEFKPGTELVISARIDRSDQEIFDGEIVEIEPLFERGMKKLIVRAFDRLHRLSRGQIVRRFVNVTDGDVIKQIANEVSLQAKVDATLEVHPYLIQANETNLDFLQRRAAALGYLLYVQNKELRCEAPKSDGATVTLEWEKELIEFRPRLSTIGQVNEVIARGWDPAQRQEIVGQATGSSITPSVGQQGNGGSVAQAAFSITAKQLVADRPVRSQEYAQKLAQAVADRRAGRFIEAEGVCSGTPQLVAGAKVEIKNAGKRFSGTYIVTNAFHSFRAGEYTVRFSISGLEPTTLLSVLTPEPEIGIPAGLVIGIVTDNNDPEKLGRVKIKYPWLATDVDSDWVRVVASGGGPTRGICFLPEVNDEVLVGFELGDINHPYVLGGLWNGKDKPPESEKIQKLVDGRGHVLQRVIRTRTGHEIRFDEDDSGSKGYIRIKTAAGRTITLTDTDKGIELTTEQHRIKLDDQARMLELASQGDLMINAKGKLVIEGQTGVELKSNASVAIQASSSLDLNSSGTATLQANATLDVKSTAVLTLQGSLVKIN